MKVKSLRSLSKKLWKVFSLFIRLRDSDEHGTARCISCGKFMSWGTYDAGHYFPKTGENYNLIFDERNVNAQCVKCNHYMHGNIHGYAEGIVKKLGQNILEELRFKKSSKFQSKWMSFEYEEQIKHYKAENKESAKKKMFEVKT